MLIKWEFENISIVIVVVKLDFNRYVWLFVKCIVSWFLLFVNFRNIFFMVEFFRCIFGYYIFCLGKFK